MGTDVTGVIETVPSPRDIKVHRLMCTRLMILVDRISKIFPDIEVCRPRCSSGIQALCFLNSGIEKAHLLFQHCSESSKLYLAITGDAILSRCLKSRNLLEQSLSQIENNVPVMLAAEISRIISDIRGAIFSLDSSEEAAGKALRELLQQYASSRPADATEKTAIEAIRFAALRLKITTQKDLLIEKRSIKKLLVKVGDFDLAKRQILLFLVSLLKRYGSLIVREQAENSYVQHEESFSFASSYNASSVESCAEHGPDEVKMDMLSGCVPPEEFKCPISLRLMYDPVVIASGQTFERMWIQKWFDEGHDTCPKTRRRLLHLSLTPNVVMKDLISKWCRDNGVTIPDPCIRSTAVHSLETSFTSIASLSNSMNNLRLPIDLSNISLGSLDSTNPDSSHVKIMDSSDLVSVQTKDRSQSIQSCPKTHEKSKCSLNNLDELPWESQCEAVDDAKRHLEHCDHASNSKSAENFVEPLIQFLKHAHDLHDVKAQRSGTRLLLEFVSTYRSSEPPLHEEAYSLLALLLNSEVTEEVLAIMEVLSHQGRCIPKITASGAPYSILNMLETEIREFHGPAIRILCNLSSSREIRSLFVPSEFIPRLVPFFEDTAFAEYCISILKNLCDSEDARASIAETDGCIASIANVLETGSPEAREHAVAVLISLCSHRTQYCHLVMEEVPIPVLNSIKTTGNESGKASAMELLRILRDVDYDHEEECLGSDAIQPKDSSNHCNKKKSSSKASGIFRMKISIFSKPSFPALKKNK